MLASHELRLRVGVSYAFSVGCCVRVFVHDASLSFGFGLAPEPWLSICAVAGRGLWFRLAGRWMGLMSFRSRWSSSPTSRAPFLAHVDDSDMFDDLFNPHAQVPLAVGP
jgi:hypothetical protein